MVLARTADECLSACMMSCDSLERNKQGDAGPPLEILYLDEDSGVGGAAGVRGRRLTAADFMGEHPVLAVKRKIYEFQHLHRRRKRASWASPSLDRVPTSPRIGVLHPVFPDALLLGEAGLRSSEDLLRIPRPQTPALSALKLLHWLLALHAQEQQTMWLVDERRDEAKVMEVDETAVEGSVLKTAEHLVTSTVPDEGRKEDDVTPQEHQEPCDEAPHHSNYMEVAQQHDILTIDQFDRLPADVAELGKGFHVKKQEVLCALNALATQRRSLQTSGYILPAHVGDAPGGMQSHGRSFVEAEETCISSHLLKFCARLVTALALGRFERGEDAIDSVYSICEQHSYLVGCIEPLSSAFQSLAEFRANRDCRAALNKIREQVGEASKQQDTEFAKKSSGEAVHQKGIGATRKGAIKRGKRAGKATKHKTTGEGGKNSQVNGIPAKEIAAQALNRDDTVAGRSLVRKDTDEGKQRGSMKNGRKSQKKQKSSSSTSGRKARPRSTKKAAKPRGLRGTHLNLSRSSVSNVVKGNLVNEGMPATRKVIECQWGQWPMDGTNYKSHATDRMAQSRLQDGLPQGKSTSSDLPLVGEAVTASSLPCTGYILEEGNQLARGQFCEIATELASATDAQPTSPSPGVGFRANTALTELRRTDGDIYTAEAGFLLASPESGDHEKGLSMDERTRNSSTTESFNSVLGSPGAPFPVEMPDSSQVSSWSEETMVQPALRFEQDALVSLPSKVLRWSVRSKVGDFIRGESSLYKSKPTRGLPFRASTFSERRHGSKY